MEENADIYMGKNEQRGGSQSELRIQHSYLLTPGCCCFVVVVCGGVTAGTLRGRGDGAQV